MATLGAHRLQLHRLAIILPLCVGLTWALGTFVASRDPESLRAAVILSLLVVASLVIFWFVARSDPEGPMLFGVLFLSLALKLLALYFRFYAGLLADAVVYNNVGQDYMRILTAGGWPNVPRLSGTIFVRLLTAVFYLFTGPTFYGISMMWAWLGLIGMLFFYKAFVTAYPEGDRRLYMILIFLYPSLLLWTSSLGKDALMMLFGGMALYGLSRLGKRVDVIGVWWLTVGLFGMLAVRPHIAAIFTVAMAISTLVRPMGTGRMSGVIRVVGLIFFASVAIGVAVVASRLVGLDRLDTEEVSQFIGARQAGTGERAGSAFTPIDTSSPVGLALLIPTVLFRPFPFEAHNMNALVAAMEGLGLLALILYRFRSVKAAILGAMHDSILLLSVFYALMFIYVFSAISNFGIIARQRVQVFPFVFIWIAYLTYRRSPPSTHVRSR
jgi:hypothetical protein